MSSVSNFHLSGPWSVAETVSPNDTTVFHESVLYITGAGNLTYVSNTGVQKTVAVPANFWFPVLCVKVLATGTTATGITRYGQK